MLRVTLAGNLGGDPVLRFTAAGKPIVEMRVAVNQRRKDKNGDWFDRTDWFRVKTMQRAEYLGERLKQGMMITAVGELQISEWQTREGVEKTSHDVWADEISFAAPRETRDESREDRDDREDREPAAVGAGRPAAAPRRARDDDEEPLDLADLPF